MPRHINQPSTHTNTNTNTNTTHRYETEGAEGGDWADMTKKEAREACMDEWKEMDKVCAVWFGDGFVGGGRWVVGWMTRSRTD